MSPLAMVLSLALSAAPPSASLHQLSSTWTDQAGHRVTLASFAGHPVVLAMIYTSCQSACPLTISELTALEAKLPAEVRARTRFVLVSFDPARDTPARLAEVARARGLTAPAWTLLTGSEDDVRELAAALGVKYRTTGGEFVHSSVISVIGPAGEVLRQQTGLGADPSESVRLLSQLPR